VKIRLLGGFAVEHDGEPIDIVGAMQRALLFRLALDAGAQLGYRALAEDVWPEDPPENARAALQSLVSRLRSQLPPGTIESLPGGYRLAVERRDVDAVRFQDLVAAASAAEPDRAPPLASEALELWAGEPWTPGDGYDWFERALADDRAAALRLGGRASASADGAMETEPSIPAALTPLIGRDEELASVAGQLAMARLVTILGPGGAGKTRLALEAARTVRRPVVVELAPAGPDELWQAILGAVGREVRAVEGTATPAVSPRERIVNALGGREVLLVLDNCEHLIDAAAEAVVDLLGALPRLRVLTTSREPLGVPGEAFVPLGPLAPDAAEELFAERVQAARSAGLRSEEAEAAARIRRRLDGLPLALELAAAKARTMTIDEIADGLDDRFALLTGGLRTVLPRHQTLRALVDWSWSLLDEDERAFLSTISIYPAGVAVPDVGGMATAHGSRRVLADALVDKSLLQRTAGRYRALETIREYGIEKLVESGLLERRRLEQAHWLGEASVVHDALLRGPGIHDALAWFDAEDDNIVSALRFAVEGEHGPEVVKLAAGNAWYWVIRDRNDDAQIWLAAAAPFAAGRTSEDALIVRAVAAAVASFGRADPPGRGEAGPPFDVDRAELDDIRRETEKSGNVLLRVFPVMVSAFIEAIEKGVWPVGVEVPEDAALDLPDWSRAVLGVMRAAMAQNRGDVVALGRASAEALERFESVGDLWGLSIAKQMRAEWLSLDGQLEEALRVSDESTTAMAQITSSWDLQQQQGLAVQLLHKLGRNDEARARSQALMEMARESESPRGLMLALYTAILLAVRLGEGERAAELLVELDANIVELPENQRQLVALDAMARAGVAQLQGELDDAERHLRVAAEAAVASGDQPVMSSVALGIGGLALERGELSTAATALDLAVALRGTADPHDALEQRIRAAVGGNGDARPALGDELEEAERAAIGREQAAEGLIQILRR
jgi:predicted ATPase